MTKHTMERLGLTNLRQTTIVLQLDDQSPVRPDGIIEYFVILRESWEYPMDFMVLHIVSSCEANDTTRISLVAS